MWPVLWFKYLQSMFFQPLRFHVWKCWLLPGHDHMGTEHRGEARETHLPLGSSWGIGFQPSWRWGSPNQRWGRKAFWTLPLMGRWAESKASMLRSPFPPGLHKFSEVQMAPGIPFYLVAQTEEATYSRLHRKLKKTEITLRSFVTAVLLISETVEIWHTFTSSALCRVPWRMQWEQNFPSLPSWTLYSGVRRHCFSLFQYY